MKNTPVSSRLWYKKITDGDGKLLLQLNQIPEVVKLTGEKPWNKTTATTFALRQSSTTDPLNMLFLLFLKKEEHFIGWCGTRLWDNYPGPHISFRLLPGYWGQHYATEAVKASIDYLKTKHISLLKAQVHGDNLISHRILIQCGFHYVHDFVWRKHPWKMFEIRLDGSLDQV